MRRLQCCCSAEAHPLLLLSSVSRGVAMHCARPPPLAETPQAPGIGLAWVRSRTAGQDGRARAPDLLSAAGQRPRRWPVASSCALRPHRARAVPWTGAPAARPGPGAPTCADQRPASCCCTGARHMLPARGKTRWARSG